MAGRPRKYPLDTLEIGGEMLIAWNVDRRGRPADNKPIFAAISQEQRRFKKTFVTEKTYAGLRVRRIS